MLYLCFFEGQNNNIPNPISIYIWKSCSWSSQDPIWKVNGVQCPDGLAYGKNRMKETLGNQRTFPDSSTKPSWRREQKSLFSLFPEKTKNKHTGQASVGSKAHFFRLALSCVFVLLCFLLCISLNRPELKNLSEIAGYIWGSFLEGEPK